MKVFDEGKMEYNSGAIWVADTTAKTCLGLMEDGGLKNIYMSQSEEKNGDQKRW